MSDEPRKIFLGSFEPGLHHLIVPAAAIRPAEAIFAAERKRLEMEAAKAKLQVMQQAKAKGRLRRALRACFGGRGR